MPADNNLIFTAETTITATTTSPVLDLHVPSGRRGLYVRVRYRDAAVASGVARVTVSVEQSADLTTWQTVATAAPIGLTPDATQGDLLLPIAPTAPFLRLRLVIVGSGASPTLTYAADLLIAHSHASGATGTDPVPPLPDPTLLVQDSFNRDDGPLGIAETGQAWTVEFPGDATGIVAGGAYPNGAWLTVDAGVTDNYDLRTTISTLAESCHPSLFFNYHDASYNSQLVWTGGALQLRLQAEDGDGNPVAITATVTDVTPPLTSGGVLRLVAQGTTFKAYIATALVIDTTLDAVATAAGQSNLTWNPVSTVGFGDDSGTADRYDTFTVIAA